MLTPREIMDRRIKEIREYLCYKEELDSLALQAAAILQEHWKRALGIDPPVSTLLAQWIKRYGPAEVEIAIDALEDPEWEPLALETEEAISLMVKYMEQD